MPRSLTNLFGTRTPFTPASARNWLRAGNRQINREVDAWLPDFLGSGNRAYGFLRHDQFVRDLERWVQVHTFGLVFTGHPLGMLRNHFLNTGNPPAGPPDTTQPATYLTIVDQMVQIGTRQHCLMYDNPIDPLDRAEPVLLPNVNFTAMRDDDDPHRLDAPVITNAGTWWFTPVQTGCTVIIADWGNGEYSMTHLRPHNDESYGKAMAWVLEKSSTFKASFKSTALQTNVTTVIDQVPFEPDRYILVQSNHTAETENVVVIGHRPGGVGPWRFFFQRYPRYTVTGPVTAAGELQWEIWDFMSGYRPASLGR